MEWQVIEQVAGIEHPAPSLDHLVGPILTLIIGIDRGAAPSTCSRCSSSQRDRPSLLRRIHDGLVDGGALIIAEKVYANSAWSHDMMRSVYYDHKRRSFSAEQILDKERSLRGQMNLWSEARWEDALCEVGFQPEDIQCFWQNQLFVAWMARKGTPRRSAGIIPFRRRIERPNDRGLVTNPGNEIIFLQDPALDPLLATRKRRRGRA
jgi:hypothetical protein